jgi:hypothetical protein
MSRTGKHREAENPMNPGLLHRAIGCSSRWGPGGRRFKSCLPDFRWKCEQPRTGGKSRETLGLADGCSRVFPAVPGTRDRKGTAAEALAVPLAARSHLGLSGGIAASERACAEDPLRAVGIAMHRAKWDVRIAARCSRAERRTRSRPCSALISRHRLLVLLSTVCPAGVAPV